MTTKSFILSSAGLTNLVEKQNYNDEFRFFFGKHEIKLNNLFAEFISPYVCQIHQSDPTIDFIRFVDEKSPQSESITNFFQKLTKDICTLFELISKGNRVNINKTQCIQLQVLSVLLKNEELFTKLNELFQNDTTENGLTESLDSLLILYQNQKSAEIFTNCNSVRCVASNLHSIDENKILQLPKTVFYSIISNEELTIENEDKLYDLIESFLFRHEGETDETDETDGSKSEMNKIDFYEQIEFQFLSEDKFNEFIENFDINDITSDLWRKFKKCFYNNKKLADANNSLHHYSHKRSEIKFDGKSENAFNGIIQKLTVESGGNVDIKNVVKVTSSSIYDSSQTARNAVDLNDMNHYFSSDDEENSWLKYDFVNRKVKPTHYSIRTRHDYGKGRQHPKNWVIEGSNEGKEWMVLDSHFDETCLDDKNVTHTFKIDDDLMPYNGYRYLRIRQTGKNTAGKNYLIFSALEYFGTLIED